MLKRIKKYCSEEWPSLTVGFVYTLLGAFIGGFIGAWITINVLNPISAEDQFVANRSAVNAEIFENRIIASSTMQSVEKIHPTKKNNGIYDKEQNLEAASAMGLLSENNYDQLRISYQELASLSPQPDDATLLAKIDSLYKGYDLLNQKISIMKSIVVASLGFQGNIFPCYLMTTKQDIQALAACLVNATSTDSLPKNFNCTLPPPLPPTCTEWSDKGF